MKRWAMLTGTAAARLLARLAPLLSAAAIGACGGETVEGAGGSAAGTGGTAGAGGSAAGTGGTAGAGGSAAGTGGTRAGAGGSVAGTGGTAGAGGSAAGTGGPAGAGGSAAGAGGTAGAGGANECVPTGGCEDVCYDRAAAGEACLDGNGDKEALTERLGCTGQVWTSSEPSPVACCYLMGFCGVGRPITRGPLGVPGGAPITAALTVSRAWI
jgi:hypothetical protein